MNRFPEGARLGQWILEQFTHAPGGFADAKLRHVQTGLPAHARIFGPEFLAPPELRKSVEFALGVLMRAHHPCLIPVLDLFYFTPDEDESEEVLVLVHGIPPDPAFDSSAASAPLETRKPIVLFLHALARAILDFQSLELACDRLALRSLSWDGRRIAIHEIWWPCLVRGPLLRLNPSMAGEWEEKYLSGVYPLLGDPFPRNRTLATFGRLAYQAAGIANPEARLKELRAADAGPGAQDPVHLPMLVEGWGIGLETLVRSCLFAHQDSRIESPAALLDELEGMLRMGAKSPAPPPDAKATPSARKRPADPVPAVRPDDETQPRLPESAPSPRPRSAKKSATGAPEVARPSSEPSEPSEPSAPARNPASPKPSASPGEFLPIGMEAALVDRPLTAAGGKKKRRKRGSSAGADLPAALADLASRLPIKWILMVAAAILLLSGLVWGVSAFLGRPPKNTPPTAVIRAENPQTKRFAKTLFDASPSTDPDGDSLVYEWSVKTLGAGDVSIEPNGKRDRPQTQITFFQAGNHTVALRLFDGKQYSEEATLTIRVDP